MSTYRRILIICHANTSRSVIAETLLVRMLEERALAEHFSVQSGGIAAYARDGALVSLDARFVLRDAGIDAPRKAVSTDLKRNRHLIEEADLILTMTRQQAEMLRRDFPEAADKEIHTLKEFAGLDGDVEDPAGKGEEVFAACGREIARCLDHVVERLERF